VRKESRVICEAFARGIPARAARTHTDGQHLFLHGNMIARRDDDGNIWATMAGWGTVTTRDRLNTLCRVMNLRAGFYQKDFGQYVSLPEGDIPLDPSDWIVLPARD
jgi:hypothetical protein